ncbi:MAG: hypothetical protein AAGH68_12800 [Pseudomonadota bacterium]
MNEEPTAHLLKKFAEHWEDAGGPSACLVNLMVDPFAERMICVGHSAGAWRYIMIGRMHHQIHGFRIPLFKSVREFLGDEIWEGVSRRYAEAERFGSPQFHNTGGWTGRARDVITRHVRVPIQAPPGFERAQVSVFEWHPKLETNLEQQLQALIMRYIEDADVSGMIDPSARMARLREIAEGQHGPVSAVDMSFIQLFQLGLGTDDVI